jgi:hypothetical protein
MAQTESNTSLAMQLSALARNISGRFCGAEILVGLRPRARQPKSFGEVNGEPVSAPITMEAEVVERVELDYSRSHDSDGQHLSFKWFQYMETGADGSNHAVVERQHSRRNRYVTGPLP